MSSEKFKTLSSIPNKQFYTTEDLKPDREKSLGNPGEYPYTRGIHPDMYRRKLWTMRQFAGLGSAEDTNERFKILLQGGQTGLSTAFDLPTLYGLDTDDALSEGEFGRTGVACCSLADMEIIFKDIPLDKVSVSMTINSPAAALWAMFLANAEKRGFAKKDLRGTLQNDILKEFIAQNEQIYPVKPSMRLVVDTVEYSIKHTPQFNPISVSGYHIRERGSTAVQELAFTLSDGFAYVDACLERGLKIDDVAPKLSFFFNAHNDFFEEICKYRAARRIWATEMKEKYGAKNERSLKMRFHTQTSGVSLTAEQPQNNIARVAIQALAAVLGGTQSLHTDGWDEVYCIPSEQAAVSALRTQQIIAYETNVINTVDPLGGSPFIETLTDRMEQEARKYFKTIEEIGGVVAAVDAGYQRREIDNSNYSYEQAKNNGKFIIVGVNKFRDGKTEQGIGYQPAAESLQTQLDRLKEIRATRNNRKVQKALDKLRNACVEHKNVMPVLIEAVKTYATLGEITSTMKGVFGEAQRPR